MTTEREPANALRSVALRIVSEILLAKEYTVPCAATIAEIRRSLNVELLEALRSLCRDGLLEYHLDVNRNPMFSISSNPR